MALKLKYKALKIGNPNTIAMDVYKLAVGEQYRIFVDTYYPECSEPQKKALQLLTYNAMRTIVKRQAVCYSRDQNHYKKNRYSQEGYTYPHFKNMVDELTRDKFLTHQMGFRDKETGMGFQSNFTATSKLITKILEIEFKMEINEVLRLHDEDGRPVEYIETKGTTDIRNNICAVNSFQSAQQWKLGVDWVDDYADVIDSLKKVVFNTEEEREGGYTVNDNVCAYFTALKPTYWDLDSLTYFRVFKSNKGKNGKELWNRHGRWYSSLSNLKSELRKHLYVNDKPTCEVDYSSHHPQILYTYEGLKTPSNCYRLNSTTNVPRELIKTISLVLLNASSITSAKQAIAAKAEYKEYMSLKIKHMSLDSIIAEYMEIHKPIGKYFLKGMGNELMNVDSKIAEYVLIKLTNQQIPCLAIHDSFIVPATERATLERIMVEAYQWVLSTNLVPAYTGKH